MILREAFGKAIDFINSTIRDEAHRIIYIAWDFKQAAKFDKSKLQRDMFSIAQITLSRTGFFHSGKQLYNNYVKENEFVAFQPNSQIALVSQLKFFS